MTKDEINARIAECEAELAQVRADLRHEGAPVIMPLQRLSALNQRQGELMTEIAGLKVLKRKNAPLPRGARFD